MKSYAHLAAKLYGRPHFITEAALAALHDGFQAHRAGAAAQVLSGVGDIVAKAVTKFTGFRMDGGDDEDQGGDGDITFQRVGPVAIVGLSGVIDRHLGMMDALCFGGCDLNRVDEALNAAANDDAITDIVLVTNSPGGSAVGTPETAALFRAIGGEKQTYGFTDSECCSAAYYIASQAAEFYCSRSAIVGSIGTRAIFEDHSQALAAEGIKINAISCGKWKLAGAPFKEMTPEERALWQATCDQLNADFRAAVTTGRPAIAPDSMEGQIFIGQKAVDAGLADGLYDNIDALVSAILIAR